jgi:hypothetical protein
MPRWRERGPDWTNAEIDILRSMVEGGSSPVEVVEALDRTPDAIRHACSARGIKRPPAPSLEALIIETYNYLNDALETFPSISEVTEWAECSPESAQRWMVENKLEYRTVGRPCLGHTPIPVPSPARAGTPIVGSFGAFDRTAFCDCVDMLRADLDVNETQLAAAVGIRLGRKISRQYISKVMRNYRTSGKVSFELAAAIAHVLGFDIWEFIDTSQADDV